MADAKDSKSFARKGVWVQVPPPVFEITQRKNRLFDSVHHGPSDWELSGCQANCSGLSFTQTGAHFSYTIPITATKL